MSDARWFEVDLDIRAAVDHFEKSIVLRQKGKTTIDPPTGENRGDGEAMSGYATFVGIDSPSTRATSEISWYFHYLTMICETRTSTCANFRPSNPGPT